MKPTEQTCDPQRIDDYLDEGLSDSDAFDFEQHLTSCERCRSELYQRTAEPEIWHDVVALLGCGDEDSYDQAANEERNGKRERYVLSVLDSLTPTDDPEMLGRVGDYEISGVVGVGGMGAVLKGFDKSLRRVVAIKVMAPHLAHSGSARTRFQREARAAAAITHDNVIDTYGVSEASGLPYLVMPFARGPSLQKRLDESGPLTALEVVRIGRQIASGLAAAHEQGLVHRDIKPANILLNEGIERLWITDFGLARAVDDASMTQTGVIAGTPQYMSPEQARGESVDQRSDLFSMGSVLYTACTGRPPFRSEAAYGILRRITDTDPRPIREINPDIPQWLCRIIERLMAKHPADRFQDAGEVAELLEGCLAHLQQPTQVELPQCVTMPTQTDKPFVRESEERTQRSQALEPRLSGWQRKRVWVTVCLVMLAGMGVAALQLTKPADIAGRWQGEQWKSVSLSTVEEATDWYTGSFTNADGKRGALQLEWSRLQRRYNGRWKVGDESSGSVTLRASGDELRGAVSVDSDSRVSDGTARLREFSWQRAPAGVADVTEQPHEGKATTRRSISIDSPIKGRIVRWGEGIHENARVEKGTFIAELRDIDSQYRDRFEDQAKASEQRVEAARTLVEAKERELTVMRAIVAAVQSQLDAAKTSAVQPTKASETDVKAVKIKVEAAKAEREEFKAARDQYQLDFERQKELFNQAIVSQQKFQESERKLKEAEAKFNKAGFQVQAAENELVAKLNEQTAQQAKAKAEIDLATAQLAKAQADAAKTESEIAKAQMELGNAQKVALESQVRVAREQRFLIVAPAAGIVTSLTNSTILKQGDTICVLHPETEQPESEAQPKSSASLSPEPSSSPASFPSGGVPDLRKRSGLSRGSVMETLEEAMRFGKRLREIKARLHAGDQEPASIVQLNRDLTLTQLQTATSLTILEGQLETARKLHTSQTALRDRVKRQVEVAALNPPALLSAEQAVATSAANIGQLQLLVEHFSKLRKEELTTPEDDENLFVNILTIQLDAARTRHRFQSELSQLTRSLFETGSTTIIETLEAEQVEFQAAAEVQRLEALLEYHDKIVSEQGLNRQAESENDAESRQSLQRAPRQ